MCRSSAALNINRASIEKQWEAKVAGFKLGLINYQMLLKFRKFTFSCFQSDRGSVLIVQLFL